MSLAERNDRYAPPAASHPFRSDGNNPVRALPTLPSMSALLNPQPPTPVYAQGPPGTQQYQPPYSITKESMWRPQQGSYQPATQNHYPAPPVPPASYFSQPSTELHYALQESEPFVKSELPAPFQHGPPLAQRRQFKKIKGRSSGLPKDGGSQKTRTSPFQSRSFEQEANHYHKKDLTFLKHPHSPELREPQTTHQPSISSQSHMPRSLHVSGLLSDAPPTRVAPAGPKYSIRMRQQPIAARACGFGERDRRVIDPPPILQMDVSDPHASPEELAAFIRQPYAVVHCTLWDPINDTDGTAMPSTTDKRQQRRLMGTLVSSPFVGKDENNIEGCFFTFPDLSVRTPGTYSLRFQLVILNISAMGVPGASSPVRSVVNSSAFNVFNAKDFGGMRASTELTKVLKHQGCLIAVKKGNSKADAQGGDEEDNCDDEEDDDQGGGSSSKRAKKNKR